MSAKIKTSSKIPTDKWIKSFLFENSKQSAAGITNDPVLINLFVQTMRELNEDLYRFSKIDFKSVEHIIKHTMEDVGKDFYRILPWNIDLIIRTNHIRRVDNKETFSTEVKRFIKGERNLKAKISKKENKPQIRTLTINAICKDSRAEEIVMKLLKEMELVEDDGTCIVKTGTAYFATIDAVKDSLASLLKRKYTDNELLGAFNQTLGLSLIQLRKRGKMFKKNKKDAIAYIAKSQKLMRE